MKAMEKLKNFIKYDLAEFVAKLIKVNLIAAVAGIIFVVIIANIVFLVKGESGLRLEIPNTIHLIKGGNWLYLRFADMPKVAFGCCRFVTILYIISLLGEDVKDSFGFIVLFSGAIILFQSATGIKIFTTYVPSVDLVVLTILFWAYWFGFCV